VKPEKLFAVNIAVTHHHLFQISITKCVSMLSVFSSIV